VSIASVRGGGRHRNLRDTLSCFEHFTNSLPFPHKEASGAQSEDEDEESKDDEVSDDESFGNGTAVPQSFASDGVHPKPF
jgi:hypothetical protein